MREIIQKAKEILVNGGTILYPTDTIWGIGCDATNPDAVKKVYEIKQREDSKSMLVLLDNENRLMQYISEVPEIAWELIDIADKPLTIIYPNAKNLAQNLLAEDKSIGIRIANHDFCQRLIQQFKKPLVSTSANISGKPAPKTFDEISDEILDAVDYIVPKEFEIQGDGRPSGIIKIDDGNRITVIRE